MSRRWRDLAAVATLAVFAVLLAGGLYALAFGSGGFVS